METIPLYPLTFTPVLKNYMWGGRTLESLGRTLPPVGVIAESWEIAGHEDGTTVVDNGPLAGQSLTQIHARLGLNLIGTNCKWAQQRGKFPLLIKLLDANRSLSVQVHPQDNYALQHEGNELGKTEMWVVLNARPNAEVILGIKSGTTPQQFKQAMTTGNPEPYLHRIPVKTGDHLCVPAGSLHAIMDGLLIAEIQQNSNTTYRVYDWNRLGTDGKPRPLHLDKAIDVINFAQIEPALCPATLQSDEAGVRRLLLCQNNYFVTEKVEMQPGTQFNGICTGHSLEIWGTIIGTAEINSVNLPAVRFCLLPATLGDFIVTAGPAGATLLRTYVA